MIGYVTDVLYIREEKIVADCLSWPTYLVTVDLCDLPAISESLKEDEEIDSYRSQLIPYEVQGSSIWCDLLTWTPRPYVSKPLRRRIFDMFHDILHPGPTPTVELIKARYFWPDMERNIWFWVKGCLRCQQHMIFRHTRTETTPFFLPSGRFSSYNVWKHVQYLNLISRQPGW